MNRLHVLGAGAISPVGLNFAQTCAAIRAGIAGFSQSDFFLWRTERESIVTATVPLRPRPIDSRPVGRFSSLARIALRECVRDAGVDPRRTALLLGVPTESRVERFRQWFDEDLYAGLQRRVLEAFHSSSALLPGGNVSVFAGLRHAHALIQNDTVSQCIVGGVDSLVNSPDLDRLEQTWRLHRDGESYGLIPGEAAAFVAVTDARNLGNRSSRAVVLGVGVGYEPDGHTVLSDGHPTGKGLEQALLDAIATAGVEERALGLRLSDLNGERYSAMDALLAMSRFYRTDRDGLPIWHPAESTGETGAASGAILLQVACHALGFGYSPATHIMCEASAEEGPRAACVVSIEA